MKKESGIDIVNAAAFTVVKKDFLNCLNHKADRISEGLSFVVDDEKVQRIMNSIRPFERYTEQIEVILKESENLQEFTFMIYVLMQAMQSQDVMFKKIIVSEIERMKDTMSLNQILDKMFKRPPNETDH